MSDTSSARVVALSGGIGGAKLALGLYTVLDADCLSVVSNTADDFTHLGLHVSPDIDTMMYTLAGINNTDTGWGRDAETWHFMQALGELEADPWFQLGDRDLATNVARTNRLRVGESPSSVTRRYVGALSIAAKIIPMSDQRVATIVETTDGPVAFQEYFVKQRCAPVVTGFTFDGIDQAEPSAEFLQSLREPDVAGVIICPSNPYISIDPILELCGVKEALIECAAPVVAVSPIIGGDSVKGPTAKMMRELGVEISPASVAEHYGDVIDGYVVDARDDASLLPPNLATLTTNILMHTLEDKVRLAGDVLRFCADLARQTRH